MAPDADGINGLLQEANALVVDLKRQSGATDDLEQDLEAERSVLGIKPHTDAVDKDQWRDRPLDEQRRLFAGLDGFVRRLRYLNRDGNARGYWVFGGATALLAGLVITYHAIHARSANDGKVSDGAIVRVIELRNRIGTVLSGVATDQASAAPGAQAPKAAYAEAAKGVEELRLELLEPSMSRHLSSGTLVSLGKLSSDVHAAQATAMQSLETLGKTLEPELQSMRAGYFWGQQPGRWFEIAWWAEFGTLVGILFYVSGCLSMGVFRTQEISTFIAELVFTPLVVCVVFLLFGFSGITSFSPDSASNGQTIGVAFILGFAIRRTVGLLDLIKKKLLPDPTPSEKTVG
jgi:hypothetical protein